MFPHDKLDWTISRATREAASGGPEVRLALSRALLSRALFHGGDDADLHDALTHARRALSVEPGQTDALVLAGLALVLLDRAEQAERYLEEARAAAPDDPMLAFATGVLARSERRNDDAITAFEAMVRGAPGSWEAHYMLGEELSGAVRRRAATDRDVEHAQFHLVRAIERGAVAHVRPKLLLDLALLCMRTRRDADAERLLRHLLDHDRLRAVARYHLGRIAARGGRHKKAIVLFRQHLGERDHDAPGVWTRIGACHLAMGEPQRAREACNRALALEPDDLAARWILGRALRAEGLPDDASRVLRELLELAPDHQDAFRELVAMRQDAGDVRWLRQALRSEVAVYDRLGVAGWRDDPTSGRPVTIDPRAATRDRIDALLAALATADADVARTVLATLDLTTDEGLRFRLWDSVLTRLSQQRAAEVAGWLSRPGDYYGAAHGIEVLTLARALPEEALTQGLAVSEADLRKAAVDRHGAAPDVHTHREHVATERAQARAWQALLLLAIASHRTPTGRNLLVRWASDADPELAVAARAGLALAGDTDAASVIEGIAAGLQLNHLAAALAAPPVAGGPPRVAHIVSDRDDLVCATCGRRGGQVAHMVVGEAPARGGRADGPTAVCSVCTHAISERRAELTTRDPDAVCALTGATLLDTPALYSWQGVTLSAAALDLSLGHEEREAIAAWFANQ
jgi:tetratricopeptide (TPR) repeat protein